jgi:hypothetical protein
MLLPQDVLGALSGFEQRDDVGGAQAHPSWATVDLVPQLDRSHQRYPG